MSCRTNREVSALPLLTNPIILAPQTLMMPAAKKIFTNAASGNAWTNRALRQIIRTGVNRTTLGNISHDCGISETSSPALIGIIGTTVRPCGLNMILDIDDIRQLATPELRNSNKLDTSIDQKFTNNMVAPPIFTEVLVKILYNSSIWDLRTRCWMNLAEYPVNIPAPQFVDLGISTINKLYKGSSILTPDTRVGRPMDVAHRSALDHIFENYSAWRHCERKVRLSL